MYIKLKLNANTDIGHTIRKMLEQLTIVNGNITSTQYSKSNGVVFRSYGQVHMGTNSKIRQVGIDINK